MAGRIAPGIYVYANGNAYGPGDTPTPEDAAYIRNPACWEGGVLPGGDDPTPDPEQPQPAPEPAPGLVPPPRSGRGSGRDHWAAFAALAGVGVTDQMHRDAIIAACEAAGVIEPEGPDGE
jgi:hypothetical protein